MKTSLTFLLAVVCLVGCDNRPVNSTAHHCLVNAECKSTEYCSTFGEPVNTSRYYNQSLYRDGLCRLEK